MARDNSEIKLDSLYREVILDHYRSPRNRGPLPNPDLQAEGYNPLCGDEVTIQLAMDGDRIRAVRFSAAGCSISQASASMMSGLLEGKTIAEAEALSETFKAMMHGQPIDEEKMGDLIALEGVRHFPVRVKCALLPFETLKQALDSRA